MPLPRRLAYKDRYVRSLVQEISGGSSTLPPVQFLPGVPTQFTVSWTQEQFTAVLSALMTGADLSYPDEAHEVVWSLLKQVELPSMLIPPAGNDSRVDLWARFAATNGWTMFYNGITNQPFGYYINQVTPGNGNQYIWDVWMTPGTWNADVLWVRNANCANGQLIWTVVGSGVTNVIGSFNMHGTLAYNQLNSYSFSMPETGKIRIIFQANGNTSPSTNYYMLLTAVHLWRS